MVNIENLICPSLLRGVNYSVYANRLSGDTLQDLLSNFCGYINECINYVNDYTKMIEQMLSWIKNEGLTQEVIKQLNVWIDDGTFDKIINQEIFGELSSDVKNVKEQIKELQNAMKELDGEVKESIREVLEQVDEKIKELEENISDALDNQMNEVEKQLNDIKKYFGDITSIKAVVKYGIDGVGNQTGKFQTMIDDAREGRIGHRIYIPKGTYNFEDTVENLGNIHLICHPEAKFTKGNYCRGGIFLNGIIDGDYNGRSAGSNITIEGGIWDSRNEEGWSKAYVGGFALGENITLKNITFLGLKGYHVTEFSGCKNVNIINCKFKGTNTNIEGTRDEAEAVQVGTQTVAGFPFFGHNTEAINIPCADIYIEGCEFENFTTAIGSHGSVHNIWDRNINANNCIFRDISFCGFKAHMFDGFSVTNCMFYQCARAVLSQGMIKNLELNRPSSLSSQYIHISGNTIINYEDTPESICIYGGMRDESEGGLAYSNFVDITNNIIQRKNGIAIRLRFCKNSTIRGNTVKSGQFLRVTNCRDTIVSSNIADCSNDVAVSFGLDEVYFKPSKGCLYTTFTNNSIDSVGGIIVNFSYCFVANIMHNMGKLGGAGDRKFISVNSQSDKIVIMNNSDYCFEAKSTPTYEATSGCKEVWTGNNISTGYARADNTDNFAQSSHKLSTSWT